MVNNTVINWFLPWPEQALFAVANSFLADNKMVPEKHVDEVAWRVFFFLFKLTL